MLFSKRGSGVCIAFTSDQKDKSREGTVTAWLVQNSWYLQFRRRNCNLLRGNRLNGRNQYEQYQPGQP